MTGFYKIAEALTMADLKTCNARLMRLASHLLYRLQVSEMTVEALLKIKDAYEVGAIEQAEVIEGLQDLIPRPWTRLLAFVVGAISGAAVACLITELYVRYL